MTPGKIINLVVALWQFVARYPALTAGLFNIIIVCGAQVGLHLTNAQLTTVAGTTVTVFALLVHAGVIPVTKVSNVKAGVKTTVPPNVRAVGTGALAPKPAPKPVVPVAKPAEPVAYTPTVPSPVIPSPVPTETESPKPEPEPVKPELEPERPGILSAGNRIRPRNEG